MRKCHFINVYVVYQPPTADANYADRGRELCGPRTRTMRTADANGADCGRERCGPRTRTVRTADANGADRGRER